MEILLNYWYIIILFFCIAILYSSVGFGGGSSYLAVLALTSINFSEIRTTALLCNIIVVTGNVVFYLQQNIYNFKKITPLVLFSIPLAYLGGFLKISQNIFIILLGITLFFAALTLWFSNKIISNPKVNFKQSFFKNSFYGGFIGFISGMVGIGGGIFLAPLLHLTHWDTPKKVAATASFFILVNSISGIFGQFSSTSSFTFNWHLIAILLLTVFVGGQIGSRVSNQFFSATQLKKTTAILIAVVSLKILFEYIY